MTSERDTVEALLTRAQRAAQAGGDVAMGLFRNGITSEQKSGKNDVVTRADHDSQAAIVSCLDSGRGPDLPVVAEEGDAPKAVPDTGAAWVVDPIDGTSNYARGTRLWTVSVAFVSYGEPVVGVTHCPALGDTYVAEASRTRCNEQSVSTSDRTDLETFSVAPLFGKHARNRSAYRRAVDVILEHFGDNWNVGSGQLSLAMVASGELDAAVSAIELRPWDTVAGVHLVRQAGGVVTDLDGERWTHDADSLVASNGRCHDELLARFDDALE